MGRGDHDGVVMVGVEGGGGGLEDSPAGRESSGGGGGGSSMGSPKLIISDVMIAIASLGAFIFCMILLLAVLLVLRQKGTLVTADTVAAGERERVKWKFTLEQNSCYCQHRRSR